MRKTIYLAILISACILCSCSNVPKPTKYPISFQKKMQATHHWDVLATDIAKEVKLTLRDREALGQQIYLEPNDKSLFSQVFTQLLHNVVHTHRLIVSGLGFGGRGENRLR